MGVCYKNDQRRNKRRSGDRLFQLPSLIPNFVGRDEEISELVSRVCGGGRVGLSALKGMGGVGKTTLAVHVAHAVINEFPDALLFLDL